MAARERDEDDEDFDDEGDFDDEDDEEEGGRGWRDAGTEGAGAMLALFAYPLLVNLLQGGPPQMWGWVKAKWTNQPYGQAVKAAVTPAQSAPAAAAPAPAALQGPVMV